MRSPNFKNHLPLSSLLAVLLAGTSVACSSGDADSANDGADHDDHDHDHDHDDDLDHDDPTHPQGRLLVSDGSEGRVIVIDLEEGEAIASLSTEGAARVYASSDGSRGFAVQGSADAVQGVDIGIRYESHGDHFDVEKNDPKILSELVVSCVRPVHFVPHHGYSAAFCDGDGMLHVIEDNGSADTFELSSFDSGRPHHGVGLVAFGHVIVSAPNPDDEEDALPIGVRALNFDGEEEAMFDDCPGLHGEAATEDHACFGCTDGVLCIEQENGELVSVKIDHPKDTEEGIRVGTLAASSASSLMIGNWGEDLAVVDLKNLRLSPLAVGEAYLGFTLNEAGTHVFLLTAGGGFQKINVRTGEVEAQAAVFPEFEVEPGHSQLKPSFVLGSNHAYVVDPRRAELYEIALKDLELTDRVFKLEDGQYNSLALVGLPPTHP